MTRLEMKFGQTSFVELVHLFFLVLFRVTGAKSLVGFFAQEDCDDHVHPRGRVRVMCQTSAPLDTCRGWRVRRKKLYQHRPQIAKTNFCVVNLENSVTSARRDKIHCYFLGCLGEIGGPEYRRKILAPCNGTQQWHHVHSHKVGRHPPPQP